MASTATMARPEHNPRPATSTLRPLHRPADVARLLGCSEWWVKEQARQRRIPYAWIGGSYRFTDEHVADIVRRFEVVPITNTPTGPAIPRPRRPTDPPAEAPLLIARPPRRSRPRNEPDPQPS